MATTMVGWFPFPYSSSPVPIQRKFTHYQDLRKGHIVLECSLKLTTTSGLASGVRIFMENTSTLPDCSNPVYTSCYCEENIYWLVKRFLTPSGDQQQWDVFAVFVSNPARMVALWNQQVGSSSDTAIIWDYHVILALREHGRDTWIYDLDTRLTIPCHWSVYVGQTFPLGPDTLSQYQRVIPGNVYLDNFASDRSHMLQVSQPNAAEETRYLSTPPSYPVICGPEAEKDGTRNNLMTHFVSMTEDEQGFGSVMDFNDFTAWCSLSGLGY